MPKRKKLTQDIEKVKQAMKNATTKDEYRRLQCIYLADTRPEMTIKEIGEITLYCKSAVDKIHSAFRKKGVESVKDNRGGRFRENMSFENEAELLKRFEEQSESGKLICATGIKSEYEKEIGQKVNKSVIYRMLARHEFRKIVPYKRHPKANKAEQSAFKKNFKAIVEEELSKNNIDINSVMIMFQDEARFGRINSPHKCWVKGNRPYVYSQIVREFTYAYGAVCPFDGTFDSLVLPYVDSTAMGIFLDEVSKRHPERNIFMFLDNASWHKSNKLKVPFNIWLIPLPAYSPELNPAEHIWDELREKWFNNYTFDSIAAVEDRLTVGLHSLENNKSLIKSTSSFNWIINVI